MRMKSTRGLHENLPHPNVKKGFPVELMLNSGEKVEEKFQKKTNPLSKESQKRKRLVDLIEMQAKCKRGLRGCGAKQLGGTIIDDTSVELSRKIPSLMPELRRGEYHIRFRHGNIFEAGHISFKWLVAAKRLLSLSSMLI
ncbi:hypothetical protein KSP39_PZI009666 [Platanthera zijinensis]|uniref:Uncharacterized protein n=1 Tax=Platanthera zijinensis TaxID=2320716 RepID=A0AAP0BLN6_9ASPA